MEKDCGGGGLSFMQGKHRLLSLITGVSKSNKYFFFAFAPA